MFDMIMFNQFYLLRSCSSVVCYHIHVEAFWEMIRNLQEIFIFIMVVMGSKMLNLCFGGNKCDGNWS